jgi:hypothetical protein
MISEKLRNFLFDTNQAKSIPFLEPFSAIDSSEIQLHPFDTIFLKKMVKLLNLPSALCEYLLEGLKLFQTDSIFKELLELSGLIIRRYQNLSKGHWPLIPESAHPFGSAFEIYIFLYNVPIMLERYKNLGIPEKYAVDILGDLKIWVEDYFSKHKKYGLNELNWLCSHLNLKTFQIGRLQFEPCLNNLPYYGFRNQNTHQSVVLVNEGFAIRKDGLFNGTNEKFEDDVFLTTFTINENQIRGNFVDPRGFVTKKLVELSKKEWQQVLSPNFPIISVHIPATGPLKLDLINNSFVEAKLFFKNYFPSFAYWCFMTHTWFMDPEISTYLPNSNMVLFQKGVYLLPIPKANGNQFYERVFGMQDIDILNFKPQTSLQTIGLEHLKKGGHWKKFAFYLSSEDIPLVVNRYETQLREMI